MVDERLAHLEEVELDVTVGKVEGKVHRELGGGEGGDADLREGGGGRWCGGGSSSMVCV